MEDSQLQATEPQQTPSPDLGRIGQLVVHRTQDWAKSTAGKLCLLLKRIISCTTSHQHWRVRLEMVELDDHLLDRCSQSLKECVGPLLEALVGAVNDEEPKVRERCVRTRFPSEVNQRPHYNEGSYEISSSLLGVKLLSECCHRRIRSVITAAMLRPSPMCYQKIFTLWPPLCQD